MNDAAIYDALLEAGHEPPLPCPVCTGDEDALPCGEDCDRIYQRSIRERGIRGLYQRCRTALGLARIYRKENAGSDDHRVVECLKTVRVYRNSIRHLRAA